MGSTFGPYRICEPLGIGGMASVHRAEIEIDGETFEVALKCLDPEVAMDRTFVRRFIDEARIGQMLKHANIARTHEVGRIGDTHFIAFEYIPGVTAMTLFDHAVEVGPPPIQVTLRIATEVARALGYAHALRDEHDQPMGLIHRDVAPSNIMVTSTGTTKLIDFGVAKSSIGNVRTVVGSVIGKLGYVAPEYLRSGKLDARADIYSLGVVTYELLTARRLFDVDDIESAESLRLAPIAPPSTINPRVPRALDRVVMRALAPDPDRRWPNANDMADALDALAGAGLGVHDDQVAAWLEHELGSMPAAQPPTRGTSEIAIDIDRDVERAFAGVRMRTEPGEPK